MSRRDPDLLLEDISVAVERIGRYVQGLSKEAFLADDKTVDAVVRNLEIIGEATRRLDEDFRARHPVLPWSQIAGMRNRIVHDYFGPDLEIVWQVVSGDLPAVRRGNREAAVAGSLRRSRSRVTAATGEGWGASRRVGCFPLFRVPALQSSLHVLHG